MTKKKLFLLALFTLLLFPLVSYIIHFFTSNVPFYSIFVSKYLLITELFIGTIVGFLVATVGWKILNLNYLKPELAKYSNLFSPEVLTYPLIIFVSLAAGIGEEVFFRGVVQPFIGITITSIIFVAVHGYLNPKNLRISIYGSYMVVAIILIGYLSKEVGLITAITAHTFIDILLLIKTKKNFITSL